MSEEVGEARSVDDIAAEALRRYVPNGVARHCEKLPDGSIACEVSVDAGTGKSIYVTLPRDVL